MLPPAGSLPAHISRMLDELTLNGELGFLSHVAMSTADQEEKDYRLSLTSGMLVPAFPSLSF